MKIVYNKKKILIVVIPVILLIILLVAGYFVLQKYSILGFGKQSFDKYSEIVDLCNKQRNGLKLNVSCKSFLELIERKEDENICFKFSVLNSSNRLSNVEICEKENIVSWDSNTMVPDQKIPIYLNMKYSIPFFGSYSLDSISFSHMEASAVYEWLDELESINLVVTDIRINAEGEHLSQGYSFASKKIGNDNTTNELGTLLFVNASIKEMSIIQQDIVINADIELKGRKVSTLIRTKSFDYIKNVKAPVVEKISSSDTVMLNEIKKAESVQLSLYFFPKDISINMDELKNLCNDSNNNISSTSVCSLPSNTNLTELQININEYIEEIVNNSSNKDISLDKLILGAVFVNE